MLFIIKRNHFLPREIVHMDDKTCGQRDLDVLPSDWIPSTVCHSQNFPSHTLVLSLAEAKPVGAGSKPLQGTEKKSPLISTCLVLWAEECQSSRGFKNMWAMLCQKNPWHLITGGPMGTTTCDKADEIRNTERDVSEVLGRCHFQEKHCLYPFLLISIFHLAWS